jgi:RimJ/RimL family protein N-acetyltransferase
VLAFEDLEQPLTDGRVALRLGAERDIPEILIAHQDDPMMYSRLGADRPPSGAELGRRAENFETDRLAGMRVVLTILEPGSDECRGQITVHHIEPDGARAELAIWVAPQVRGRGYARHALTIAGRWLLERCGLERLTLLTETDNEPMIRAARAAGFVEEAVLRKYARRRSGRVDALALSLLPTDLEA